MDHLIRRARKPWSPPGGNHLNGLADMAFITIYFPAQHHRAHQRELAVAGEGADHADWRREKMLVWNDLEADEKIKVYDKGVEDRPTARASTTCWSATAPATCGRRRSIRPRL